MKKHLFIILIFWFQFTNAQQINAVDNSIKYIQDYYSYFSTGYNFDGKYITVTDNYKAKLEDSQFTLTFDAFDTDNNRFKNTISFDLKEIISIEPYGVDNVEIIGDETQFVPLNGKIAFKTATNEYILNSYYEVDEDVEQTEIYKAFSELIKLNNNK